MADNALLRRRLADLTQGTGKGAGDGEREGRSGQPWEGTAEPAGRMGDTPEPDNVTAGPQLNGLPQPQVLTGGSTA